MFERTKRQEQKYGLNDNKTNFKHRSRYMTMSHSLQASCLQGVPDILDLCLMRKYSTCRIKNYLGLIVVIS